MSDFKAQSQNTKDGAVVALSGGLDSCVTAALAVYRYGRENVYALGFYYGQKHSLELESAAQVAEALGIPFELIELPKIFSGGGSSLVDSGVDVEQFGLDSYENIAERFGAQPTVVPNRNMNFIAMSVTYALTHGVNRVLMGVHGSDSHNFHYPDCTPQFIGAMNAAAHIGNSGQVEIEAPFNYNSKANIVGMGIALRAPLNLTQSCYQGKRPACGKCATCLERIDAFKACGYTDPIPYEIPIDWNS